MAPENVTAAPIAPVAVKASTVPRPASVAVSLVLPVQIFTHADVSRLSREAGSLDTFFATAAIKGATSRSVPQVSLQLNALINENKLNILRTEDREKLSGFLVSLRDKAPVVHASFASDPKPEFLMKLVMWFRREAHPYVLLQVGLQPNIAAGCIFRTTNKYFDFSFKRHFEDSKSKLKIALGESAA